MDNSGTIKFSLANIIVKISLIIFKYGSRFYLVCWLFCLGVAAFSCWCFIGCMVCLSLTCLFRWKEAIWCVCNRQNELQLFVIWNNIIMNDYCWKIFSRKWFYIQVFNCCKYLSSIRSYYLFLSTNINIKIKYLIADFYSLYNNCSVA